MKKNEKNIKGYAAHRDASLPVYVSRRKLCSKTWLTRAAPATIPSTWPPPLANSKCKKPRSINPWTQQPWDSMRAERNAAKHWQTLPSGKHTKNYGKIHPFLMGKLNYFDWAMPPSSWCHSPAQESHCGGMSPKYPQSVGPSQLLAGTPPQATWWRWVPT